MNLLVIFTLDYFSVVWVPLYVWDLKNLLLRIQVLSENKSVQLAYLVVSRVVFNMVQGIRCLTGNL